MRGVLFVVGELAGALLRVEQGADAEMSRVTRRWEEFYGANVFLRMTR